MVKTNTLQKLQILAEGRGYFSWWWGWFKDTLMLLSFNMNFMSLCNKATFPVFICKICVIDTGTVGNFSTFTHILAYSKLSYMSESVHLTSSMIHTTSLSWFSHSLITQCPEIYDLRNLIYDIYSIFRYLC